MVELGTALFCHTISTAKDTTDFFWIPMKVLHNDCCTAEGKKFHYWPSSIICQSKFSVMSTIVCWMQLATHSGLGWQIMSYLDHIIWYNPPAMIVHS
jgi:hypothetical protein